ncbi:aminotransferase class V-fold PLP-dependent enzyme [Neobacillus terrae]|uniref:aminotransferase class V-fold PLP-dependent enzyme n=1 Tax=Neobacillus terrae TaxID=3034837 RepID=UPI00140DA5E8|nr:aminotransferase class V-fold PLP-dependent enzyme [Neobacillus terrae]NHM31435.1 aminotransferase class V-fold PLP-dependent enzyme [Neobacillus terrae]
MFKLSTLPNMSMEQAIEAQFSLTEAMAHFFGGEESLSAGDYGVKNNKAPQRTQKVEQVLARFFGTEDCALVRGSGTGGIRLALTSYLESGDKVMVHDAPIYTTTKETFRMLGLKPVFVDYHNLDAVRQNLSEVKVVYIQHSFQQIKDSYRIKDVIDTVKSEKADMPILVDDNYTVFKTPKIGVHFGADISTFSGFKVLGPEGIGVVVGKKEGIEVIKQRNYSGGGQVQGPEAMELLRALVHAPVLIAIQGEEVKKIADRLNGGELDGVEWAQLSNSQSRNVIVKLKDPIAYDVLEHADELGGAIHPVGAESKYEILPMIYRVSGAFLESAPDSAPYLLRINPMRSGADLTIDIIKKAIEKAKQ